MFVMGSADLGSERLDLTLATQPRRGLGISAGAIVNPFYKIGGTFASPQLRVDATSAALTYGMATATGGLSILATGLRDRLLGNLNPCDSFRERNG